MRRRLALSLLGLVLAPTAGADEGIVHERVRDPSNADLSTLVVGQGDEAAAILYQGRLLEAPSTEEARPDEPLLLAVSGVGRAAGGAPSPTFRPDRVTSLDRAPGYHAAFTPSVAPFKRVTALDRVRLDRDGTPILAITPSRPRPVPVVGLGAPATDHRPRDRFWGTVRLDFRRGARAALPSVSPESRILSFEVDPPIPLRFERDGADNFYAVTDAPHDEPVRLVFLTDAPRTYFNTPPPEVDVGVRSAEVSPIPPSVKRRALGFARELGLTPRSTIAEALAKLVGHFRGFRESDAPPLDRGDIFLDLARGGVGVCRHRAYAFVITAQALGLPSRYVQNEAHAWVEVAMGDRGFMRIDLGGSAVGVRAHGMRDRPLYSPAAPDPLPRPPEYLRSLGRQERAFGEGGAAAPERSAAAEESGPSEESEQISRTSSPSAGAGSARSEGGAARPGGARIPLVVELQGRRFRAYRGRALDLAGRIVDPEREGIAGLRVEVLLEGSEGRHLLGVTVTSARGVFAGTFGMPVEMPVGDYDLIVRTPGDEDHSAAEAR